MRVAWLRRPESDSLALRLNARWAAFALCAFRLCSGPAPSPHPDR